MEAEIPVPWHLRLLAKAKNFQFKLKAAAAAATSLHNLSLKQFSVLLNLYSFQLKIDCDSGSSPKRRRNSFRSKFLRVFKKFRSRRGEKTRVSSFNKRNSESPYAEDESDSKSKSSNRQYQKLRFRRADNRSVSSDGNFDKLRLMQSSGGLENGYRFAVKSWVILAVSLLSACTFSFVAKNFGWDFCHLTGWNHHLF